MPKSTSTDPKEPLPPSLENPDLYPSYTNGVFDPDKYEMEELDQLFENVKRRRAERDKAAKDKA